MKKAGETYESVGEKTPPSSREGEGTERAPNQSSTQRSENAHYEGERAPLHP